MAPADNATVTADKKADAPRTAQVIVAQGRTVQVGRKQHAPNALIELPAEEAAHLVATGFAAIPAAPSSVPVRGQQMPSPGGPTVNGVPGGVIKPG